ncbi:type I-C CRISPR-associated protein Cas5c [Taylorella asinigenitalis]|uniref:type I-C CRISPR-associated protein Cas5c n=1 Tax=Taylorella asinigenitalis TaxID=84590 RepID=UPI00048F019D|nr:type I-C CRISPR-associated protein Cas5c [Taylorella asinigenitalis]
MESNYLSFKVWGREALFTDPLTKLGGEKFTYQVPTYEAIKGIVKSIYWKPTFIWYIDKIRIINPIKMASKSMKPRKWNVDENSLSYYTYLTNVEYQVLAHFTWNENWVELEKDRNTEKHSSIAKRMLERGGRQDIFLGSRECQGYVEPCEFNSGNGFYDDADLTFGNMFHSYGYPEETGENKLINRFWSAEMKKGIISFPEINDPKLKVNFIREMRPTKCFGEESINNTNNLYSEIEE